MSGFSLDATKWKPVRKGFRYVNLVGKFSTKNGKLFKHTPGGWLEYVDPEHVYRINGRATVVRYPKEEGAKP